MQRAPACIAPELAPMSAKIRRQRPAVAADGKSQNNQPGQRQSLGYRENILQACAESHSANIDRSHEHHYGDASGIAGTCAMCHNQCVLETVGKKTPRNFPNATQTAAIVPVWITRKSVHP